MAAYALSMMGSTGEVRRVPALATIYPSPDEPGEWIVGSLDSSGDGGIYLTCFSGPNAERRALEYAEAKYSALQRRD